MRFRMRQNGSHDNGHTNGDAPVMPAAPEPIPAPFAARPGGFHSPMKSQISGSDVRTERFVRQVRGEMEELRQQIGRIQEIPEQLTELDLEAVAADPQGAASLPPGLLVRALVEARDRNRRLEKRLARQRDRIERLEERVRDLKQERAWMRGRQETFEEVVAALHANLQDLRLFRDSQQQPSLAADSRPALGDGTEREWPHTP